MSPAFIVRAAEANGITPDALRGALAMLRQLGGYQPKKLRAPGVPAAIQGVIAAVAAHYGYELVDLRSPKRSSNRLARARGEAVYVARVLSDVSYPELARFFGGRHHATIMFAHEQFSRRLEVDELARRRVEGAIAAARAVAAGAETQSVAS